MKKIKKVIRMMCCLLVGGMLVSSPASAQEASNYELLERIKHLDSRMKRIEGGDEAKAGGKWFEKITLSGAVEVEASHEAMDFKDPAVTDTDNDDIVLATVELGVDVDFAKHVGGHVLFLWEEDDTDPVEVDEGFIILDGEDVVPLYLSAGKMCVPFGYYESHFISDPITLELGETKESALKGGVRLSGA